MSSSSPRPSTSKDIDVNVDDNTKTVEDFHGVYLLVSLNPRMRGRTYIGFTVDPTRRLEQHNRGREFGGAARTSNRGPWAMVLIVHGFPNQIAALRFEWAWQHPRRSRRLAAVPPKKAKENMFTYNFRLLGEMLNVGPWNRLPLTVQWLRPDVRFAEFPPERRPPQHMPVLTGPVRSAKKSKKKATTAVEEEDALLCSICIEEVDPQMRVTCLSDRCQAVSHLLCLAEHFRKSDSSADHILPVEGKCPVCEQSALWGDLIRKKRVSSAQTVTETAKD